MYRKLATCVPLRKQATPVSLWIVGIPFRFLWMKEPLVNNGVILIVELQQLTPHWMAPQQIFVT